MAEVSNIHVTSNIPLPAPALMMYELPRSGAQAAFVAERRREIHEVIFGSDDRFLVVVGPCSIHSVEAGREYAERLAALQVELDDRLLLVMRVYFEKPRTNVGWKGLIMDPRLDGSSDIHLGLRVARDFLRSVLDLGVATATELLDPITPQYIADLITWSAVGARTTESQTHRQMASGLSMPLGFKNATPGTIEPAINAIRAAVVPQSFLGVSEHGLASAVRTSGNPSCHLILRGGDQGPNYEPEHVAAARAALAAAGLPQAIMVDASHGNCGKDHRRMPDVFREIVTQRAGGDCSLIGAMLESNLKAGAQKLGDDPGALVHGLSITDECIDWDTTEELLRWAHTVLGR